MDLYEESIREQVSDDGNDENVEAHDSSASDQLSSLAQNTFNELTAVFTSATEDFAKEELKLGAIIDDINELDNNIFTNQTNCQMRMKRAIDRTDQLRTKLQKIIDCAATDEISGMCGDEDKLEDTYDL